MAGYFIGTNVFGYVFHALVSRKLGPALYAEFSILYALLLALSRPVSILSNAVARVAVTGRASGVGYERIKKFSKKIGLLFGVAMGTAPVLFSPLIRSLLNTGDILTLSVIGATLFFWTISAILRGLLTAIEAFGMLSYTGVIELFFRAVFGVGLVYANWKVFGALAGSAIGSFLLFILLFSKRKIIADSYSQGMQQNLRWEGFRAITAKVFFIAVPTGFFLELDLLLTRRFFSPEQAGVYAAAALIGKGLLLFSTVASSVVYPKLVEERFSKKGVKAFFWGVGITLFLFAGGFAGLKLFGKPVVGLLFGPKYAGVVALAPLYVLVLIPLALHLQVTNYKGAIGGWTEGIWLWIILGGYCLSLVSFSSTLHSYLEAIFFFHLAATPISFIVLYLRHKSA
jgi:O-antigen/teichoic acid export membrane protein